MREDKEKYIIIVEEIEPESKIVENQDLHSYVEYSTALEPKYRCHPDTIFEIDDIAEIYPNVTDISKIDFSEADKLTNELNVLINSEYHKFDSYLYARSIILKNDEIILRKGIFLKVLCNLAFIMRDELVRTMFSEDFSSMSKLVLNRDIIGKQISPEYETQIIERGRSFPLSYWIAGKMHRNTYFELNYKVLQAFKCNQKKYTLY